jgi:hypothetical protein
MSSKAIVLKSAFVQEDRSVHVQSSFDNDLANLLRSYASMYR